MISKAQALKEAICRFDFSLAPSSTKTLIQATPKSW